MNKTEEIIVRLPNADDLKDSKIVHITDLINRVYDDAESGMWKSLGTRTNISEVEKNLTNRTLILAELEGRIVGSVKVQLMDKTTGEFGSLVANPDLRGIGIGSALVKAAEQWAIDQGCSKMRLEVLFPRSWQHPSKEFLRKWYSRIGYEQTDIEPFEKMHPDKVNELATEVDFTVWYKSIG